jgi:tetratricopeptide (TPR) repeat protein
VLSIQRKVLGDENATTLETFTVLAKTLQREGKLSESESVLREASAIARKLSKYDDLENLFVLRDLAETLEEESKWPEAEAIWRESLPVWRKRGGLEEQQSMYTLRKLGLALEAEHKWPEAESIHREALGISRKKGDENPEALVDLDRVIRSLVAQNKFIEAQQALDKILSPAFVAKPGCVDLLVERVNLSGRCGRWQEAEIDAGLLRQLQPGDHYHYHRLAVLLAFSQKRPAYDELCQKIVTTFTNSQNPYVNERMAQDCLLLPDSGVDLMQLDKLADAALTLGSGEPSVAYFRGCKAMSNYRLGHFREAIEWAEKANQTTPADPSAKAKAFAVLAMANWRLGNKDAAQAALANGDEIEPKPALGRDTEDLGESWVAWLVARVSLDEATALIRSGTVP